MTWVKKEAALQSIPEIKCIKANGDKQESTIVPGNDDTAGTAVGSPSMNGIWWMQANEGSDKLASFFCHSFLLYLCLWKFPLHMCVSHQDKEFSSKLMAQQPNFGELGLNSR